MYQLTLKSKWRTFLHCCNCAKSDGEAGMNALAAEGHSHVATSAEQKGHDNLWRISLNCPRSNTSTTFPNVPTVTKSWQIFMRRKMEAVAARQVFHSHIPVENRIRQSQKQKCNLKERVRRSWRHRESCCLVRQLWFIVESWWSSSDSKLVALHISFFRKDVEGFLLRRTATSTRASGGRMM